MTRWRCWCACLFGTVVLAPAGSAASQGVGAVFISADMEGIAGLSATDDPHVEMEFRSALSADVAEGMVAVSRTGPQTVQCTRRLSGRLSDDPSAVQAPATVIR